MCMRAMLSLHLNASLKSYPLLQTLMIEHATYLCVRSSHEAIHYASALVSAVASAASCFFVIGNRSKKSLAENPTEQGGARRLWAPTCKHWMVSAATPAFPYLAEATSSACRGKLPGGWKANSIAPRRLGLARTGRTLWR